MSKSIPFLELASMHADLADELKAKFAKVLQKGLFSGGEEVEQLEITIKAFLKVPFAISCANGTDALELSLRALDIGPGDEVIVPALTWVSTAEVVKMVGAEVKFVDVDSQGLMDLELLENQITPKTKVIIPVHLYGKMVNMTKLLSLTEPKGIKVVEDAAQALGAFQHGKSAGSFGDIGCFSFYPTKNLGALGEAGLMVAKDEELAKKLRLLLNNGQPERDQHDLIGKNSRIDTLQAAFLNVKMEYFQAWQQKRKALSRLYLEQLQHLKELNVPQGILYGDHNAHLFTVFAEERDELRTYLADKGIGTAIHYPLPVPMTRAFGEINRSPKAYKLSQSTLSLPLHPYLGEEEVRFVSEAVRSFYRR